MKYLALLLLSLFLMFNVSCSSGDDVDDSTASEMSEEIADESADFMDESFEGGDDEFAEFGEEEVQADFGEDEEFADDFSEESSDEFAEESGDDLGEDEFADDEYSDEFAEEDFGDEEFEDEFLEEEVAEETPVEEDVLDLQEGQDVAQETPMETFEEPMEEPMMDAPVEEAPIIADTFSEPDTFGETEPLMEEVVDKPSWVPVKKIKTIPFTKAGRNLNTVYIIRPGDTPESVSEKLYGSMDTGRIYSSNPHLTRSFKTGDKLYYESPNRPGDSSKIITYYEDNGIPSQTRFVSAGENIRAVSQDLLGDPGSWKEIWATNMALESKGEVLQGTEVVYWPEGSSAPMQNLAMNDAPSMPEPMMPEPEPAPMVPPAPPVPPMQDPQINQPDANMAGTVAQAPAPPVPPAPPAPPVVAPPAPPAPPVVAQNDTAAERRAERARRKNSRKLKKPADENQDLMITLGAALIVVGGGLFLVVKKNKAKKMQMDITEQTQI